MPIYEYECTKCGHYLEALQKIADKPLRECPECGKHALKRLVSAPMFRLSGSGWYETDFKSDQETKRNLVDKGDKEAAPDPKGESKTDSKSDSKDDSKSGAQSDAKGGSKPQSTSTGKAGEGESKSTRSRTVVTKSSRPAKAAKPANRAVKKKSKSKANR